MTATPRALPTLTEVIELEGGEPKVPLPLAAESEPIDTAPPAPPSTTSEVPRLSLLGPEEAARIVDAVVARLQPQLEAWLRERIGDAVRLSLQDTVQASVDAAAADVARRLRMELPVLARAALDEVRPDSFES